MRYFAFSRHVVPDSLCSTESFPSFPLDDNTKGYFPMYLLHKAGLALALLTLADLAALPSAQANGPELVANGGFETGDFSGWTIGPAGDLNVVSAVSSTNYNAYPPHSGLYSVQFASSDAEDDVLTQTLATSIGSKYSISFWLAFETAPGKAPLDDFKVAFGGDKLLDIENANDFPYTHYQFSAIATGATTSLTFSGRTPPGTFYLDDISVTDAGLAAVPEASSVVSLGLLLLLGVGGLVVSRRRKMGAVR